jgi:hypothetical protein
MIPFNEDNYMILFKDSIIGKHQAELMYPLKLVGIIFFGTLNHSKPSYNFIIQFHHSSHSSLYLKPLSRGRLIAIDINIKATANENKFFILNESTNKIKNMNKIN